MKASEKYLAKLSSETFLSLWRFPAPTYFETGKPLCGLLVVCDPHVIIFSVKKVSWKDTEDEEADFKHWMLQSLKAIKEETRATTDLINRESDPAVKASHEGLPFPDASRRQLHLIGVALGGKQKRALAQYDSGGGFVHVFDQPSFDLLLAELDTISDLIYYLFCKEKLAERFKNSLAVLEEELLASHLASKQKTTPSCKAAERGKLRAAEFFQSDDYLNAKNDQKSSYAWDNLIKCLNANCRKEFWSLEDDLTHAERAARTMARESRSERIGMAKLVKEYLNGPRDRANRACVLVSPSGTSYMFMLAMEDEPEEECEHELRLRTLIARNLPKGGPVVVGIAIIESKTRPGFMLSAHHIDQPNWPHELKVKVSELQRRKGYFRDPKKP